MTEAMTYKTIYSDTDVLDYFGDNKALVGAMLLEPNDYRIDVDSIIHLLGLDDAITVDPELTPIQQPLAKAYALGGIILKQYNCSQSEKLVVTEKSLIRFARDLLTPKPLIVKVIDKMANDFATTWEALDMLHNDTIVTYIANNLAVPQLVVFNRLRALGVME